MSDTPSLRDRYFELIDRIVQTTLKGNIRSKEQVYQFLLDGIRSGSGEIFEQCLDERLTQTQRQLETEADEFRQAKASRTLRAIRTIQGEWERWQEQNKASEAIATAIQQLITVAPGERLTEFLRAIDPNHPQSLTTAQLKQLAKVLRQNASLTTDPAFQQEMQQFAVGIERGLESWSRLQSHVVSWIYESDRDLGFEGTTNQRDPWGVWAKHLSEPLIVEFFQVVSKGESIVEFGARSPIDLSIFLELVIVLQYLQQGLIAWCDQLVYDSDIGAKLSISSFLMFAIVWCQVGRGLEQANLLNTAHRSQFADAAFQVTLQILRTFAQRPYFPLYGSIFASFPGTRLRSLVNYLNEPLKRIDGTQEKARILTLIGSSERAQGRLDHAKELHDVAREIAAEAGDRACEIANLNHLSRTCVTQKNYEEAIRYSQRALIQSRQLGDRQGEANALVNLGYSEVIQAHQREQSDPDAYEAPISYLQQGVKLAEQLGDRQSQAFGFNSLGIAHLVLEQPDQAVNYLSEALRAAQAAGDLYLQGLDLTYLAEAYYRLQQPAKAIYAGGLGMYYLDSIASREWRQAAGLLTVLQGQMGEAFQSNLETLRSEFVALIGVDGYDHLALLIEQYRNPQ